MCKNPNISESFFEKYIFLSNRREINIHWLSLCENPNLSESFFEKYIENVNWYYLCQNTNISEQFFEKYFSCQTKEIKIWWSKLCANTNMSDQFFEKHISEEEVLNWKLLCENTNLSESFFEKHIEKIKLKILNDNNSFDNEDLTSANLSGNSFRTNHSRHKIIYWLKKNPIYPFDKLLHKYI